MGWESPEAVGGQLGSDGEGMAEMEEGAQICLLSGPTCTALSASSGVYRVCPVCQAPPRRSRTSRLRAEAAGYNGGLRKHGGTKGRLGCSVRWAGGSAWRKRAGRAQLSVGALRNRVEAGPWGKKPQNSKARTVGHCGRITNFISFFEARLH